MNETGLANELSVKVLREDEMPDAARRQITSEEALQSRLPDNCVVIPMQILEEPEPIKRSQ